MGLLGSLGELEKFKYLTCPATSFNTKKTVFNFTTVKFVFILQRFFFLFQKWNFFQFWWFKIVFLFTHRKLLLISIKEILWLSKVVNKCWLCSKKCASQYLLGFLFFQLLIQSRVLLAYGHTFIFPILYERNVMLRRVDMTEEDESTLVSFSLIL